MYEEIFDLGRVLDLERNAESRTWARDWERLVTAEARIARAKKDTTPREGTIVVTQRGSRRGALAYLQMVAGLWPR